MEKLEIWMNFIKIRFPKYIHTCTSLSLVLMNNKVKATPMRNRLLKAITALIQAAEYGAFRQDLGSALRCP